MKMLAKNIWSKNPKTWRKKYIQFQKRKIIETVDTILFQFLVIFRSIHRSLSVVLDT